MSTAQRRETLRHEYQDHEEHRCLLRVLARRFDVTEEELLQELQDEIDKIGYVPDTR